MDCGPNVDLNFSGAGGLSKNPHDEKLRMLDAPSVILTGPDPQPNGLEKHESTKCCTYCMIACVERVVWGCDLHHSVDDDCMSQVMEKTEPGQTPLCQLDLVVNKSDGGSRPFSMQSSMELLTADLRSMKQFWDNAFFSEANLCPMAGGRRNALSCASKG